jgi:ribosomal protein S18 acetylase RimI-like enzyme
MDTRTAIAADASIITHHRRRMYVEAGRRDDNFLALMAENFEPWVARMMEQDKYVGWLTMDNGKVIAGVGLLILDWPPHPLDPRQCHRGYLLNLYVEPEYRRRKLATNLIEMTFAEARSRQIRVVALHSTDEARPLYEGNGFRATNEMFRIESDEE